MPFARWREYEDLLSCWRESIFIILVSGESYATSGASDLYVKPKGPGGDAVCSFGDNLHRTTAMCGSKIRAGLPEKK